MLFVTCTVSLLFCFVYVNRDPACEEAVDSHVLVRSECVVAAAGERIVCRIGPRLPPSLIADCLQTIGSCLEVSNAAGDWGRGRWDDRWETEARLCADRFPMRAFCGNVAGAGSGEIKFASVRRRTSEKLLSWLDNGVHAGVSINGRIRITSSVSFISNLPHPFILRAQPCGRWGRSWEPEAPYGTLRFPFRSLRELWGRPRHQMVHFGS